jgi:menaquinone-dependent protoporphyrinogen oxidase
MKTILIAYATTEGQSRKIAEFIAERVRARGHEAELLDTASSRASMVQPMYAGAFVGGSVHQNRHQSSLMHFVKANVEWLNRIPTAFFSVSLAAAGSDDDDRHHAQRALDDFLTESGLAPGMRFLVAGALKYTQYDFFKRWIMKSIARQKGRVTDTSQDFEYTDWAQLQRQVDEFMDRADIDGRKVA